MREIIEIYGEQIIGVASAAAVICIVSGTLTSVEKILQHFLQVIMVC